MLLDRLRCETRPQHERIERDLALLDRPLSAGRYRRLLARFYGFHAAWEPAAAAALGDDAFFGPRRKTGLLAADLEALGLGAAARRDLPLCPALPPLGGPLEALGSLYVLEGSTLGGQLIARHVERSLGPQAACAYFRSYGRAVGPMWRALRARLMAASSPAADGPIVAAAGATFERLHAWLCRDGGP